MQPNGREWRANFFCTIDICPIWPSHFSDLPVHTDIDPPARSVIMAAEAIAPMRNHLAMLMLSILSFIQLALVTLASTD